MNIVLVNTNRIKPPIAPIGLDYVAEVLHAAGHRVKVLDLCWHQDWPSAVVDFFNGADVDLVGLTLRNTDDCAFTSRQSFLDDFFAVVRTIRDHTDALIVVGGVGFSVMPEYILGLCKADFGVIGDGEFALASLADRIESGKPWKDVSGLVYFEQGNWYRNPPSVVPLSHLPVMSRRWIDNRRYFREGGQAGFETKRGCGCRCVYCVDPLAKGNQERLRPADQVAAEIGSLLEQGIDHLHTCDSEFNLPSHHAHEVCDALIRNRLETKIHWYAYCSPASFSPELARKMRQAGCVGINFGVDSGDPGMLKRLRRNYGPDTILFAASACRTAGMTVMFDLLLGSPGETQESIVSTIELMKSAGPDRVGIALGVRVYGGTELSDILSRTNGREGEIGGTGPSDPRFFLEPAVAPYAFRLLDELIGNDERFLFFDPSQPDRNYNYNANDRLVEAIRQGYRGAYWDILRRYDGD